MGRIERALTPGALLLSIPMLVANVITIYGVRFVRPIADDYCTIGSLRNLGFWRSQVYWYISWTGNYSSTASANAIELIGPRSYPWAIGIILTVWLIAIYYLFRGVLSWAGVSLAQPPAILLSMLSAFALFSGTPNAYQSLYWLTGFVDYALPLVLLTLIIALAVRLHSSGKRVVSRSASLPLKIGAFLVGLLVGGYSETTTLVAGALLGLSVVVALRFSRPSEKMVKFLLLSILMGVVAGGLIQLASPGNQVRLGLMPPPPDIYTLLRRSVRDVIIFLAILRNDSPLLLSLSLITPFAIGLTIPVNGPERDNMSVSIRTAIPQIAMPLSAAVLIMLPFMATEFAQSSYPDGRVLLVPYYLLVLAISLWSLLLGRGLAMILRHRSGWRNLGLVSCFVIVSFLVVMSSVSRISRHTELLGEASSFARQWDIRNSNVLRAGATGDEGPTAVASLPHIGGLSEISRDPENWVNRCFAQAYDLDSVTAK